MAFDIAGARKAGYSNSEIADFLAGQRGFDAAGARKSGYSDDEIVAHLSQQESGGTLSKIKDAAGAIFTDGPSVADQAEQISAGASTRAAPVGGLAPMSEAGYNSIAQAVARNGLSRIENDSVDAAAGVEKPLFTSVPRGAPASSGVVDRATTAARNDQVKASEIDAARGAVSSLERDRYNPTFEQQQEDRRVAETVAGRSGAGPTGSGQAGLIDTAVDWKNAASDMWTAHLPSAIADVFGLDNEFAKELRQKSQELTYKRQKQYGGAEDVIPGLITRQDIRDSAQNVAFSVAAAGLAAAAGISTFAATKNPAAAWTSAAGAAGTAGYNMDTAMVTRQLRQALDDEMQAKHKRNATPEEWQSKYEQFKDAIHRHGLHEAVWEAAGSVAFGKIVTSASAIFGKSAVARFTSKMLLGQAGEELSEAGTQIGQHNEETSMGLNGPNGDSRSYLSAKDWGQSLKEVLPSTLLTSVILGNTGMAGNYAYRKGYADKRDAQSLFEASADGRLDGLTSRQIAPLADLASQIQARSPNAPEIANTNTYLQALYQEKRQSESAPAPAVDPAAPTLTRASQAAQAGIVPNGATHAAEILGAPEQPVVDKAAPTLTRASQVAAAGNTPLAQHTGAVAATSLPVQNVAPPIIEPAIHESAPADASVGADHKPGSQLANGFYAGANAGERYSVGLSTATGGIALDRRYKAGTQATFYVSNTGALIDADNIDVSRPETLSRLWKTEDADLRGEVFSTLRDLGKTPLGAPERKALLEKLKALVTGADKANQGASNVGTPTDAGTPGLDTAGSADRAGGAISAAVGSDRQLGDTPAAIDGAGQGGAVLDGGGNNAVAGHAGNPSEVVLPDNSALPAQWEVVDADQVTATLKEGRNQPRDRSRAASDIQVQGIANAPDYRRLADSPVMDVGAPTLSLDGAIVGGNGRFEGVSRAYDQGTAAEYLASLKSDAVAKGIDPAAIDGMKKPVLVRRITQPFDTRALAVASNSGGSLQYSALEQAKIDGERMGGLDDIEVNDAGDVVMSGANMANVRRALTGYNAAELGSMTDKDGLLSQEGIRRIKNAMLYKAYGSNPTLSRLVESADNDLRAVSGALVRAAGAVAQAKGRIAVENDIAGDIVAAVEKLSQIKQSGQSVEEYLAQRGLFGSDLTQEAADLLKFLSDNIRSQKRMAEFLREYYNELAAVDTRSGALFAGEKQVTKQERLTHAIQKEQSAQGQERPGGITGAQGKQNEPARQAGAEKGDQSSQQNSGIGDGTKAAPITVENNGHLKQAEQQVNTSPTEAQKEAGNYAKAHVSWNGLDITIENPAGSERSGKDANGKPWSVTMPASYGYIKRTEGADGDHVDVYVGKHLQSDQVFIVDQLDANTGKFDEHKVMLAFPTQREAERIYKAGFSDKKGAERMGAVTQMTVAEFKEWLKNEDTTKPAAFSLDAPDKAELEAKDQERIKAEHEAKRRQEDVDRKEAAERERENVRQRSEGAAAGFQLGQSAEENLSGQGSLLVPTKPPIKPAAATLSIGKTPNTAEPISIRGGVLYRGDFPILDYETADEVRVPEGAPPALIDAAIRKSGSLVKGDRIFGIKNSNEAVAGVQPLEPSRANTEQQAFIPASEIKNTTSIKIGRKSYNAKKLMDAANKKVERLAALLECVK